MAIIKDVTVKINNGTATLDAPIQFYEKDHDVELRFKLMDYKYKYDKDPQNILNSVDEDILEAYTTIVNPRGYELEQINGVVKNDTVIFRLDPTYTDELDELGTYKLQIHIKCTCSEFTIPPISFEVLQRLKGIKVVTDGEDEVDNSEILDNSSKFVSDETGKLIIEWKKGDMISSAKLNAMVDVINDAVDEEVIRQENEIERQTNEIERQRKVDASIADYETRFNALTVSQQQDAEVIDARDGEQTLRARLDRDIQKPLIIYEEVEGSYISCDGTEGYVQNVEILGNTIQNQNDLADIRSVGDKLENQELYKIPVLSCGKNLLDIPKYYEKQMQWITGSYSTLIAYVKLNPNTDYTFTSKYSKSDNIVGHGGIGVYLFTSIPQEEDKWYITQTDVKTVFVTEQPNITINKRFNTENYKYLAVYLGIATNSSHNHTAILENTQLEEGTQATPYEPYQENKLTILSPVQLKKVGDVADRIICKDGVWGVEKNVEKLILNGSENWIKQNMYYEYRENSDPSYSYLCSLICNRLPEVNYQVWDRGNKITGIDMIYGIRIRTENFDNETLDDFKKSLQTNNVIVYYNTQQTPQFIPLPYDQQIKLRTFAGKTNILFLTEIEGTIKASIPQSIGATVNTHSEQIDILGKELEKINNLEESVTSEVVSESDFITVKNTNNGYFEDVKLEGRTLVNLIKQDVFSLINKGHDMFIDIDTVIPMSLREYTLVFNCDAPDDLNRWVGVLLHNDDYGIWDSYPQYYNHGLNVFKLTVTQEGYHRIRFRNDQSNTNVTISNILLLEGDYTQNPPSYFEGIKSVGQDVDEISVLSCNENLFDKNNVNKLSNMWLGSEVDIDNGTGVISEDTYESLYWIKIEPSTTYTVYKMPSCRGRCGFSKNKPALGVQTRALTSRSGVFPMTVTSMSDENYLLISGYCANNYDKNLTEEELLSSIQINKGATLKPCTPHQSDKKRILYYNDETQTWEKPILRQWDSIEKHTDGKYYYHKRSGEVVLDGSENWKYSSLYGRAYRYDLVIPDIAYSRLALSDQIKSDRFKKIVIGTNDIEGIGHHTGSHTLQIQILDIDKLTDFKQWLQANPTTVVYQLATEKVYECTNIDLITYADETNLIVSSGVINPKASLKISKGVVNVVTMLQNKVTILEQMVYNLMKMLNNEQSNIDE